MNKLAEIVAHKRTEIERAKQKVPLSTLKNRLKELPPSRDFYAAIANANGLGIIAEVKRASPSAGIIREVGFDPVAIAKNYAAAGADCISILTDEKYFSGHLDYLIQIRREVSTPLLRKDFVLDTYQIMEAKVSGADAILLIAECLSDAELKELYDYAHDLELAVLLEIFEPENLSRALVLKPKLLGVNNRNLKTFETSLSQTTSIAPRIPAESMLISESALKTREDIYTVVRAGAKGVLVGETLMRAENTHETIREFRIAARNAQNDIAE